MKKLLIFVLIIALTVTLLAGCTPATPTTEPMSSTEMSSEAPTMAESKADSSSSTASIMGEMKDGYTDLEPAEAKKLIDTTMDLIIIDVSPKYAEGHLPKSINYYLGDGSLDKAIPGLDKEKTYLVYCHVDSVAIAGAKKLVDAGFKKVYRLKGNYSAWVDAGYPVEK